jgi:hypothetical protein
MIAVLPLSDVRRLTLPQYTRLSHRKAKLSRSEMTTLLSGKRPGRF